MPHCSVTVYKVMTPPPPSKTEAATAAGTTPVGENTPDSFVTRHFFNLGCFHRNPQALQANIGDGNFQTGPNTFAHSSAYNPPFSQLIQQQYTLPRTCWQSVWAIISKRGRLTSGKSRNKNILLYEQGNQLRCSSHSHTFIYNLICLDNLRSRAGR